MMSRKHKPEAQTSGCVRIKRIIGGQSVNALPFIVDIGLFSMLLIMSMVEHKLTRVQQRPENVFNCLLAIFVFRNCGF